MLRLISGNEAVARGAYEAGVSYASGYPGTPSTEILEHLAEYPNDVIAEWAPNEKVAFECALGASIAGGRALASMKMVGVNVAADPLFSSAYSGVNGGLVLVSADDPGLHSSQNEQDNRFYARFAKLAMLEPSDSTEARDMAKAAFELSEKFDIPVLLRMTTRLCHSKGLVYPGHRMSFTRRTEPMDLTKFNLVPAHARRHRFSLEAKQERLAVFSEECEYNRIEWNGPMVGIITSGVAYQYAKEVFGETASYLKLGFTHPLPKAKIREFGSKVDRLFIIEELEPYIEDYVKQLGLDCIGKDRIPRMFELNPTILADSLLDQRTPIIEYDANIPTARPPVLCAGCPHRGFFYELGKIVRRQPVLISGDIGCYALGGNDPLNAHDLCICMGAAPSVAHGAQKIFEKYGSTKKVVAVIGDSTFFHSGIPALANNVFNRSNSITCILDNRTTAMTGQQDNPGTGVSLQGKATTHIDIEAVVRSLGIDKVRVVNPMRLDEVREALAWAFGLEGPSVVVTRWPCTLKKAVRAELEEFSRNGGRVSVYPDMCTGCRLCLDAGCPALSFDDDLRMARIDRTICNDCGLCIQICKWGALTGGEFHGPGN